MDTEIVFPFAPFIKLTASLGGSNMTQTTPTTTLTLCSMEFKSKPVYINYSFKLYYPIEVVNDDEFTTHWAHMKRAIHVEVKIVLKWLQTKKRQEM